MRSSTLLVLGVFLAVFAAWGCSSEELHPSDGPLGSLSAAIELSEVQHDVTGVRLDIVAPDQDCGSPALFTKTVALETEALPASLAESGTHAFADGLFVLAAGSYRVCATPLAGDMASAECDPTNAVAQVRSGFTTEIILVSQCRRDANGGLDVVVGLNDRPQILDLVLAPSKFITTCESVHIAARASDPNGDSLTFSWSIFSGPNGASLRADGSNATFSGPAGDYVLVVSVDDDHGGVTFLQFPIHISAATCAVPNAVQAIFQAGCSPCHTVASQGGLHLDPATASYAALVNVGAVGAGCTDRIRVVPGNAASSYLVAKLRGAAGICGLPMPRNRPALPEDQIQTIEAWINGLPH